MQYKTSGNMSSSVKNLSTINNRLMSLTLKSDASVDEQSFLENFERVPPIQVHSSRDMDEQWRVYQNVLKNKNEDWVKRVDCLKKIRSLVVSGHASRYDGFQEHLKKLLPAFHLALEDLRSKVVREACITVAFLSKSFGNKLDTFLVKSLFDGIIKLILRTQKVFVMVAHTCAQFILQYTHNAQLIQIIANNLNSKSNNIRRACSKFINVILKTWHKYEFEKFSPTIQQTIRKGISDADAETRSYSRDAYTTFAQHFPQEAEKMKDSIDGYYRKSLYPNSCSSVSEIRWGYAINSPARQETRTRTTCPKKIISKNCERSVLQSSPQLPNIPQSVGTANSSDYGGLLARKLKGPSTSSPKSPLSFRPASPSLFSPPEENDITDVPIMSICRACNDCYKEPLKNVANISSGSHSSHQNMKKEELMSTNPNSPKGLDDNINYELFCENLTDGPSLSSFSDRAECSTMDAAKMLRSYLDELSHKNENGSNQTTHITVLKLTRLCEHCPSSAIITHFRPLLARIMKMTLPSESTRVRKAALNLLQMIAAKNEQVIQVLKEFSELVVAQVVSLCGDPSKVVVEAATNCATTLSTHLPAKNVVRILVPMLEMDETTPVKLICIEMLRRLVGRPDNAVILENIDQIMPVLESASYDTVNTVKRAAVTCIEALYVLQRTVQSSPNLT